jgi:hypothetical protein
MLLTQAADQDPIRVLLVIHLWFNRIFEAAVSVGAQRGHRREFAGAT